MKLAATLDFELPDLRPTVARTVRLGQQQPAHGVFRYGGFSALAPRDYAQAPDRRPAQSRDLDRSSFQKAAPPTSDRTELSWAGGPKTVPAEARTILRGITRGSQLQPGGGPLDHSATS